MSENTYPNDPPQAPHTPSPAPPMLESEARTWAMLVHIIAAVAALLSAGFLSFIAPLIVWLLYRERSALVDFHGKQNLNLQLTLLVTGIAAFVLGLVTLGFGFLLTLPAWLAYGLYAFVISIIAGVKANNGEYYRIGLTIRFIR
ncbi:DUF4870 domain-containing protein [Demequina sp. SO4-18]|uniref:DUF4870 domain-containing protein n=1 Tax=Demequina sp. SO4-18 TaxID=3401026 RepID=UPI003B591927